MNLRYLLSNFYYPYVLRYTFHDFTWLEAVENFFLMYTQLFCTSHLKSEKKFNLLHPNVQANNLPLERRKKELGQDSCLYKLRSNTSYRDSKHTERQ